MFSTLRLLFGSEIESLDVARGEFLEMLEIGREMFDTARAGVFDEALTAEQRSEIYRLDRQVNKLERSVRRRVLVAMHTGANINAGVVLLHVVKDAERVGDYCKNIAEVRDYDPRSLGDTPSGKNLQVIMDEVAALFGAVGPVMVPDGAPDDAVSLLQTARELCKRCDQLLVRIAASDMDSSAVTAHVLMSRFTKRVAAHLSNILSAVVMPLHKIDYFDESELDDA